MRSGATRRRHSTEIASSQTVLLLFDLEKRPRKLARFGGAAAPTGVPLATPKGLPTSPSSPEYPAPLAALQAP